MTAQKYYHARLMFARAVIDGLEFARSARRLQGEIEVAQLGRVGDSLFDTAGVLRITLRGDFDAKRRPRLKLTVDGEINLRCQRCLGALAYPLAVKSSLLVLMAGAGSETVGFDDLDGVPASPQTKVQALVEDEVLLAIPIAPRHPDGQCTPDLRRTSARGPSPFAVLERLKRN